MVAMISINQLMMCASIYVGVPFLLYECKKKGVGQEFVGLFLALLPIAQVIAAPFVGGLMIRIGRRKMIVIACVLQFSACFGTALITMVNNKWIFSIVFGFARIVQGIGSIAI